MRVSIPVLAALAALAVPAATAAASSTPALVLVANGPVQFSPPTARCPIGVATADVTVLATGETVSSTACGRKASPCGTNCTRYRIVYEIPLAGGTIRERVVQRQVMSADHLVTGVALHGVVSQASGSYAGLLGAAVTGGGAIVVQPDGSFHLSLTTAITPTS